MACFVVPAAEAVIVKAIELHQKKKEMKGEAVTANAHINMESHGSVAKTSANGIPFSRKLNWLVKLLAGGSFLLAFEHIWHGEVTPWFPFLTAAATGDTMEMLHEMATTGVGMAALVTLVWVALCKLAERSVKNVAEEVK